MARGLSGCCGERDDCNRKEVDIKLCNLLEAPPIASDDIERDTKAAATGGRQLRARHANRRFDAHSLATLERQPDEHPK